MTMANVTLETSLTGFSGLSDSFVRDNKIGRKVL